jgi:hypothetical protein
LKIFENFWKIVRKIWVFIRKVQYLTERSLFFEPESCICTPYIEIPIFKILGKIFFRKIQNLKEIFWNFLKNCKENLSIYKKSPISYLTKSFILNQNRAFAYLTSNSNIQNTGKIFWPEDPNFKQIFWNFLKNCKENLRIYKESLISYQKSFFWTNIVHLHTLHRIPVFKIFWENFWLEDPKF